MIALIAAVARNGVIGRAQGLPWRLPADLRFFKENTLGKPVIMGRTTYQSIGKALPGRRNLVLTRTPDWRAENCEIYADLHSALAAVGDAEEIMVIGGASVYAEALPLCQRLYLTHVDAVVDGDSHFPEIDWHDWQFKSIREHPRDADNPYDCRFVIYERV